MSRQSVAFVVRAFPPQLHKKLKRFSKREGRTMTWIILKAVEEYLDRHEKEEG